MSGRYQNFTPGIKPEFDVTGHRFGKLVVEGFSHRKGNSILLKCICDCGNTTYSVSFKLRNGMKTSCGCTHYKRGEDVYNYSGYKEITGTKWNSIVHNAKIRNLEFLITKEDVWQKLEAQKHLCKLSGLPVSFKLKSASVDRIDSTKPYTVDNIQILHKDVNKMKMDFPEERFLMLCKLISEQT